MTPSLARNALKRALKELVDPPLTAREENHVWAYFGSRCAFCGVQLVREGRKGHLDHLVPESQGGTNCLANRVLSCSSCNGDEKLDAEWKEFLRRKADSDTCYQARLGVIAKWTRMNGGELRVADDVSARIQKHFDRVDEVFTDACEQLRMTSSKSRKRLLG